jgi:hypothetical protein
VLAIKKVPVIGSILILFLALCVPFAVAQDDQSGGSGLLLSPTRTEISAQPGEKQTITISIRNITSTTLEAQAFINDFESDNVSGTPQIIVDESQRTPYTISKMISGLSNVTLKPNELKEIKLDLDVPGNAAPGAYFGAIRYAAVPKGSASSQDRQVSLTASVAHLVFVEVPGDINQQIQLESLKAQRDGKSSWLFLKAPNQSALGVKNLGNGFSRPFGDVIVKNMFGKETYKYSVNDVNPKGIILPQSARTFVDKVENVKIPGRYTITAAVAYGNGGEVVTYKSSFWYIPVWLLIAILAILAAGGYFGRKLYKARYGSASQKRRKSSK